VHVGSARLKIRRFSAARAGYSCGLALIAFLFGSKALQNAIAEGDTRTISLHHIHTDEDITITFKRDGRYDEASLEKLNWFLRDWRRNEQTRMDPHLIDLVWEVQREAGAKDAIQVVCGYRSPQTNAMLRHRSARSGVARFSQHMLGHAMDFYVPGVPLEQLREYGLRLQRGGVGFYPESGSPFVHMDIASVRMWPRMTREQLVRVFPDGRTVLIPTDGKPLPGYALALADLKTRGGAPSDNSLVAARDAGVNIGTVLASNEQPHANPFAKLLGLTKNGDKDGDDEDAAEPVATASASAAPTAPAATKHPVLAAIARDAKVAEKATVNAAVKVADAASKVKLIRTAEAKPLEVKPLLPAKVAPPARTASTAQTPSQIIAARGYWEGPQDGTVAPQRPANPLASAPQPRGVEVASSDPDMTGSVGPFAAANLAGTGTDRVTPDLALAYAEQPGHDAGIAALRAAASLQSSQAASAQSAAANDTTVAMKRTPSQLASAIVMRGPGSVSVVRASVRFEDPWLRAVVLSPSVRRYLTTMVLGAPDFRTLAALMVKPPSAVMMTFAADPNPGLAPDHFTGAAIVFVSTVSYPTRTASLR
jgi:uncharacterized protein YcbK (DUF882 family)